MASIVSRRGSFLLQRVIYRKSHCTLRQFRRGSLPEPLREVEAPEESTLLDSVRRKHLFTVNSWKAVLSRCLSNVALEHSASSPSSDGLIITESCIKRLQDIQKEEKTEKLLRLSVEGGGCSGFLYTFSLEDAAKPDDRVFAKDGVKVIVDEVSMSFLKGSTVDFTEELIRSTFVVVGNPNSTSSCGCGSSFTAK